MAEWVSLRKLNDDEAVPIVLHTTEKMAPQPCARCRTALTVDGRHKYCPSCQQEVHRELCTPCKKVGCEFKRSPENAYCRKHQAQLFIDETEALGKRTCTGFIRGCRERLDPEYKNKKCPTCLEKDRAKEKNLAERKRETLPETEEETGNKRCSNCFKYRPPEEFVGEKGVPVVRCVSCRDQSHRVDMNRNRERRNEIALQNSRRLENRFKRYQKDARDQGICFEIPFETFPDLTAAPCRYCGTINSEGFNGVDRVDPRQGFTVENSAPCCTMCNRVKHILPEDVFLRSVEHIATFSGRAQGNLDNEAFKDCFGATFTTYQNKAQSRNMSFELSRNDFDVITASPCYLCGKQSNHIHKNGVDRVDSSQGYVSSNVKPCCGQCNCMKGTNDLESFLSKTSQIYHYQASKPN
jgi:hypothetical protein